MIPWGYDANWFYPCPEFIRWAFAFGASYPSYLTAGASRSWLNTVNRASLLRWAPCRAGGLAPAPSSYPVNWDLEPEFLRMLPLYPPLRSFCYLRAGGKTYGLAFILSIWGLYTSKLELPLLLVSAFGMLFWLPGMKLISLYNYCLFWTRSWNWTEFWVSTNSA